MEFNILFYQDEKGDSPIEEFLLELGKINRILVAKTQQGIEKLKNKAYHREPLSKYLEPGLWELRIKAGNDILRIIYTFAKGQIIILLHIFIKKKQKTPMTDFKMARKRLKEIKLMEVN
ncbi:type II toxin-antitoxin system RelE/ParE family toxin [Candidatus Gottesmanbacteria bacterium]|nr:type II toxin-antitoxin system RelE/ParE family toxin [Candidatus Gottesmanbacteria bacterium]